MNYYVYQSGRLIGTYLTEKMARDEVARQIELWRIHGGYGHPEFRIGWNGALPATIATWPAMTFAAQAERDATRVESERPLDGVQIPTKSELELAAYRMPNGSRFVTLVDASEATWEAYCVEQVSRSRA